MTEQPRMVPSIAIIDANVLEATGLKSILCDIVPKVTVSTFKSLSELQQAMQDGETFAHYFASPQVVLEHSTFFLEHARQTIVLTAQPPTGKLLERFRCLSSSMTEHDLIKAVLSLHQMGHGGHPHPPFHHGNIPEQEMVNDKPVSVGVATWKTMASYRNARLTVGGTDIPLEAMKDWKRDPHHPHKGVWETDADGILHQTTTAEECMCISPVSVSAKRYTYEVQARKEQGAEGFMIVFNYVDEKNFDWLNLGGWGNSRTSVETTYDGGRNTQEGARNDHYETGRWYDIRIDVDGNRIVSRVDGKIVYEGRKKNTRMHGVYANSTLDEKTGILYTKIVNLCASGTTGTLNLSGGTAGESEMVRLYGLSGEDENTMQYPDNIVPRPAKVQIADEGRKLTFDVPAFSINIITTKLN